MYDTILRFRGFLGRYFELIVVALLILALLSGFMTYTVYANPDQVPQEQVVSSWNMTSEFGTSATVTEENPVFPVGTELDDRSVFFTRVAPILNGTFTIVYSAPSAEDVTVEIDLVLVQQSVDEDTVYWSETKHLETTTATDVAPSEPVETSFSVNATAATNRLRTIETELGQSPGDTEGFVRAAIRISGVIDGEPTAYQTETQLPIDTGPTVYEVTDTGPKISTVDRTETVMVNRDYGPLWSIGAPLVLALSLSGLLGIGLARAWGVPGLTQQERDYLTYRDDRTAFDEWITQISLPAEVFERPTAEAATLSDLVDFAIDSDTGVIENRDTGQCYVVQDEYLYTFTPPSLPPDESAKPFHFTDAEDNPPIDTHADIGATNEAIETPTEAQKTTAARSSENAQRDSPGVGPERTDGESEIDQA